MFFLTPTCQQGMSILTFIATHKIYSPHPLTALFFPECLENPDFSHLILPALQTHDNTTSSILFEISRII